MTPFAAFVIGLCGLLAALCAAFWIMLAHFLGVGWIGLWTAVPLFFVGWPAMVILVAGERDDSTE